MAAYRTQIGNECLKEEIQNDYVVCVGNFEVILDIDLTSQLIPLLITFNSCLHLICI